MPKTHRWRQQRVTQPDLSLLGCAGHDLQCGFKDPTQEPSTFLSLFRLVDASQGSDMIDMGKKLEWLNVQDD